MKDPIRTACTRHCGDGCSLLVATKDDGSLSIRGNPDHPFTRGFLCAKTTRFGERLNSPRRIVTPLIRTGGPGTDYREVSWEEALGLIAGEIQRLRPTPERMLHIFYYASFGLLFQASRLLFGSLGTSGFSGSPCLAAGVAALKRDFGALRQGPLSEAMRAARIVNWGRNAQAQSVHLAAMLNAARKNGSRVLSIHPGDPGYDGLSDEQIVIRPGTDRFLAAAASKLILESGRASRKALERCANQSEFLDLLGTLSLDDLLGACGATRQQAETLAGWYASGASDQDGPALFSGAANDGGSGSNAPSKATATLIGRGVQRYAFGGENIRFIDALAMLSGNVGRPGGGVFHKQGDLGSAAWNWTQAKPGYARLFPIDRLARAVDAADPPAEFVWVEGHNLVTQAPESLATKRMLEERFTVVVEPFLTDTARCATVILPPALMFECEDLVQNDSHEFVNHSAKVLDPRGQARSNFDIAAALGARLAPPVPYPAPDEVMDSALREGGLKSSLAEMRAKGWLGLDAPDTPWADGVFAHPDGLYRLPEDLHPDEAVDDRFPLRLLSPVRREYLLSQIPEDDQESPPLVFISPECEALAGLGPDRLSTIDKQKPAVSLLEHSSGEPCTSPSEPEPHLCGVYPSRPEEDGKRGFPARLETALGSMEVRVAILESLHPDAVLYPRGDWLSRGGCVNRLITGRQSDMGGQTAFYEQRARLTRA